MKPSVGSAASGPRALRPVARFSVAALLVVAACGAPPDSGSEPVAISLVDRFAEATVQNPATVDEELPRLEWRFDGEPGDPEDPLRGWTALHDVENLEVRNGRLVGRAGEIPLLSVAVPESSDRTDSFHALELELRISAGSRLGVSFLRDEKPDAKELIEEAKESGFADFRVDLEPGEEVRKVTVTASDASFRTSHGLPSIRHVLLRWFDAEDADFEIVSMRLVTLKEHLASIPSGVGWHGLADVFRETVVARAPERIVYPLELPSDPFLDLAIGTVENGPVTFRVEAEAAGGTEVLLERTISTPDRWQTVPVDLRRFAGQEVALALALEGERDGATGFWGAPVVRNRGGRPATVEPTPARVAVVGDAPPPQGVLVILADTLRRDHLAPWGYDRDTAPVLAELASEGAVFRDAISQGSWTKVSVSSIITSLYPSTHGVSDMPDRLPASVTTLAEAYRSAGYATFATSSVPFTGRLTNLHQGVEVLHESTSLPELEPSDSKTARTYTDRLLDWIEVHRDVPFFAFLHVFDPHSPFEPYRPWDDRWMSPEEVARHREEMEKVKEFIEEDFFKRQGLAKPSELEKAGIDRESYVTAQKAWYDASIRAMDVEVGRVLERLEELGIADRVLIALGSDHGEEFLEHGRPFHGYTVYGEMLNVPLMLSWRDVLPARVVETTVQNVDLMPTLLELSRLPVPEAAQGQSLLPLLAPEGADVPRWRDRPAFAERAMAPLAFDGSDPGIEAWTIVDGGWKLIRNGERPEGHPEIELYDHREDPLNLENVADEHPEVVERLSKELERWRRWATEARIEAEEGAAEMSEEELEKLRALGYVQ